VLRASPFAARLRTDAGRGDVTLGDRRRYLMTLSM
jgi:hypothetical protein